MSEFENREEKPIEQPSENEEKVEQTVTIKEKVIELLKQGLEPKEIAERVGCSKQYVYRIRKKLQYETEQAKPEFEIEEEEIPEEYEGISEIPTEREIPSYEEKPEVEKPSKEQVRKMVTTTFNLIFKKMGLQELDDLEERMLTDAYYPVVCKYFHVTATRPEVWAIIVTLLVILPRIDFKKVMKIEVVHRFPFFRFKKEKEEG